MPSPCNHTRVAGNAIDNQCRPTCSFRERCHSESRTLTDTLDGTKRNAWKQRVTTPFADNQTQGPATPLSRFQATPFADNQTNALEAQRAHLLEDPVPRRRCNALLAELLYVWYGIVF